MSNLLDKASIILTPTAYNNGEALCVKPSDGSGDFDFSRNSAATRVNAQGLVENVQILSSNLVQNGDFSEEGSEEVSNGSFSQEGSELITNGNFDTDSDWGLGANWNISNGKANAVSALSLERLQQFNLGQSINRPYKVTFSVSNLTQGSFKVWFGSVQSQTITSDGDYTIYLTPTTTEQIFIYTIGTTTGSIDNVSVREVGQDWEIEDTWTIGDGVANGNGATGSTSELKQYNVNTIGKTYKATFEVLNYVSGTVGFWQGSGVSVINRSADGIYTEYFTATSAEIRFRPNSFNGSITNISVKEVGQNWDLQTGWEIANNKLNCLGASSQIEASTLLNFDITKKYKLVFTISGVDSGTRSFRVYTQGSNGGVIFSYTAHTNGTYEYYYDPSINGTKLAFQTAFNQSTFSIDDVSVIEITDDTNLPRINYEGFSYQDALGSEEVVNGTFDSDTAWSKGAGWSIANGEATHTGGASYLSQSILNADTQYKVNISVTAVSGGGFVQIYMGNSPASVLISTIGDYTYYFTSQSIQTLGFALRSLGDVTIDNVSVKEYLGQEVVPDSGCGSWLFEPQSTNLITQSELFSDASWVKINSSVVSGFASPSGNINAYKLIGSVSNTDHRTRTAPIATAAVGTAVTFSIYIKPQEITKIALVDNWTNLSYGVVNLTTNSVIEEAQGTTSVTEILNGFRRVSFTYQTANINTLPAVYLLDDAYTSGNPTSYTFASDGTSGVYIWGAQLEQQTYATSYIPTSGSTVTRNQDVCINGGSLATINSTEGTLYAQIAGLNLFHGYISISDGTSGNSIRIGFVSDTLIKVWVYVGNSQQISQLFTYDTSNINKIAVKYSLTDFKVYINGSNVFSTTSVTFPIGTLNELAFRRGDQYSPFYGKTKALAVWKEALSDEELTELTTI